jgi:protein TonB
MMATIFKIRYFLVSLFFAVLGMIGSAHAQSQVPASTGDFKNGDYSGQGTFTYPDGRKHVGEFKNGKYSGKGAEYASDGSVLRTGVWADGKFVESAPIGPVGTVIDDTGIRSTPAVKNVDIAAAKFTSPKRVAIQLACPTMVAPLMPKKALQDGTTGTVKAQIHIKYGVIQSIEIMSGPRVFHAPVKVAMMQYKCVTDGADVIATQEFNFKIEITPPEKTGIARIIDKLLKPD